VGGWLEFEDILTKLGFKVGFVVWFQGGVVVGCVCWRHTTMSDGTWGWWMLSADVSVRTLGGARCGAPVRRTHGGGVYERWRIVRVRSIVAGMYFDFEVGGARAVGGT
jgi:hypothetical protein